MDNKTSILPLNEIDKELNLFPIRLTTARVISFDPLYQHNGGVLLFNNVNWRDENNKVINVDTEIKAVLYSYEKLSQPFYHLEKVDTIKEVTH